jgi:hypothetical protein
MSRNLYLQDGGSFSKFSTYAKSKINRLSGIPEARDAYPGELHPMSRVGNKVAFNNFLGPNTNVSARLKRGDKGISRADKAGKAHDLRFALAKNTDDLRKADNIFISKLKELELKGEPKFNTQIGIKGIQLKNKLEDSGIWSKEKFLNPFTDQEDISNAKRELGKLEQQGYGVKGILPGNILRKRLAKPKTKYFIKGRGIDIPKLMSKKILPHLVQMIKARGLVPKAKIGRGDYDKLEKYMRGRMKGGSLIAGLITAASLLPVGIEIGKVAVPFLINLFKKKKHQVGKGVIDVLGKLLLGAVASVIKEYSRAHKKKMSGSGLKDFLRKASKKFVDKFISAISKGGKVSLKIGKELLPIAEEIGPILLKDALIPFAKSLLKSKTIQ